MKHYSSMQPIGNDPYVHFFLRNLQEMKNFKKVYDESFKRIHGNIDLAITDAILGLEDDFFKSSKINLYYPVDKECVAWWHSNCKVCENDSGKDYIASGWYFYFDGIVEASYLLEGGNLDRFGIYFARKIDKGRLSKIAQQKECAIWKKKISLVNNKLEAKGIFAISKPEIDDETLDLYYMPLNKILKIDLLCNAEKFCETVQNAVKGFSRAFLPLIKN